jgi:hypothetical protein
MADELGEGRGALPLAVAKNARHCDFETPPAFCDHCVWSKEEKMSIGLLAIDLGKHSFHIHGIDSDGTRARPVARSWSG